MAVDFAHAGGRWAEMGLEEVAKLVRKLFPGRPRIREEDDLQRVIQKMIRDDADDFCWSLCFAPPFISSLFYEGFLPICGEASGEAQIDPLYVLLPKLHRERCIINLPRVKFSRGAKKRAKHFTFTVDTAFPQVVKACIKQHGPSWLYPPMQRNFLFLFIKGKQKSDTFPSSIHSIEVWDKDGTLVAGELGYVCGSCYTSLTGFYCVSGAGGVQLAALGGLLVSGGFSTWDLGMSMSYKEDVGGVKVSREDFLLQLRRERECTSSKLVLPESELVEGKCSADKLIKVLAQAQASSTASNAGGDEAEPEPVVKGVTVSSVTAPADDSRPAAASADALEATKDAAAANDNGVSAKTPKARSRKGRKK